MKLKTKLSIIYLLASCMAYGQSDTAKSGIYLDTLEEPVLLEKTVETPFMDEMVATEAPYEYVEYNPVNKFKYNKKIKTEEKPDKKAVYGQGLGELLKQISNSLSVPYGYGSENKYVILQFVVGRDSLLYNPEILYSPGTEYSINATAAIEKLQQQFLPATKNGKPVDTIITIPVRFERKSSNGYGYRDSYH